MQNKIPSNSKHLLTKDEYEKIVSMMGWYPDQVNNVEEEFEKMKERLKELVED